MRVRHLAPFVAGLLAAFLLAGFPASAADQAVVTSGFSWSPANVQIGVDEKVTWSDSSGIHNLYVEGQPDALASEGAPWSVSQTFSTAGTYKFRCAVHSTDFDHGMVGTVTVGGTTTTTTTSTTTTTTTTPTGTGTGTGTSTTPPPNTMPTDTITNPTQIEQNSVAKDTSKPSFVGKPKRRASRKALILELRSSEAAKLSATILRRPPRGRTFSRIGNPSVDVKQGRNVVTLPRKQRGSLRSGSYKLKLQLVDASGNKSGAVTLSFKIA